MAYEFNAITETLTAGTTAIPTTGTLSLWLQYQSDPATTQALFFDVRNDASNAFQMSLFAGSMYCGWYTGAVEHRVISATVPTQNAWGHFLLTWDDTANVTVLYKNGSSIGTQSASLVTFTSTGVHHIGNYSGLDFNTGTFLLSEAAIFGEVLSAPAIASLAGGASPAFFRRFTGQHYWPLVRGLQDLWGGDTATNSGASVADHPRIWTPRRRSVSFFGGASAVLTGTAIGGITEADVVAGGKVVTITVTGDAWIAN